ncbi:MAG: TIR domain-containing protein [Chloroflexi bacterium]|nr:TIR domain-containing protein [Chloroflexota bacterium]
MKLFVSYRRKSWPFTSQLVNNLRRRIDAEIFLDYRSVDETDFEESILRHLRESDVVLLIVSEYTFAPARIQQSDDWVRREIREGLTLKKPIVAVFIDGLVFPNDLPADIRAIRRKQGVPFYPEYFAGGVKRLAEFLIKATPIKAAPVPELEEDEIETDDALPPFKATFADAIRLFDEGDFDKSIFVLEELRDSDAVSPYARLEAVLGEAKRLRDLERRLRDARIAYSDIAALARSRLMRDWAREAWNAFRLAYPDFREDPDKLAVKLAPPTPKPIGEIIASVSDRSADDLSLDDVLSYFASPVDSDEETQPQPLPNTKKGASSKKESARITQEAKRL